MKKHSMLLHLWAAEAHTGILYFFQITNVLVNAVSGIKNVGFYYLTKKIPAGVIHENV